MTRILVVDDSPMDRTIISGLLRKKISCEIDFAEDGSLGLESIKESRPDLIVTDMQMPVMNGLEMIVELRKRGVHTPVVLITASGSEELSIEALRAGASSYVPKRSLSKQLVETVRTVLSVACDEREKCELMERIVSHCESFRLKSRVEECRSLARHLQGVLADLWDLDSSKQLRIRLVLEEALLNALYHGNLEVSSQLKESAENAFYELAAQRQRQPPYSSRQIEVESTATLEEVRFIITDDGDGFDVSKLPDPTDPENILRPYGRGVTLMRSFMDEVRFSERGNQVTLVKRRC